MAVPILLAGAALGTGAAGLSKLFQASGNNSQIEQMLSDALNHAEYVTRDSVRQSNRANLSLDALGRLRLICSSELMTRYVATYKQVKNIEYNHPILEKLSISRESFDVKPIEIASSDAAAFIKGGISTLTAGAAAGYGAYGLATYAGVASTGTAISALSGAALQNATLAWLGGGALSAGGMGMAGGTAVLGGVVAGPALLVMGLLAAKKSEERLTAAVQQESDIRIGIEQIQNSIVIVNAIESRAREIYKTTHSLASIFIEALLKVEDMVAARSQLAAAQDRRKSRQDKLRKEAHANLIAKRISALENDELEYKKNTNIFVLFWNWITKKSPDFSKLKAEAIALPENPPQIIEKFDDPLDFNNFSPKEQDAFQIFTMLGANLHGLLKVKVLDDSGAINQSGNHIVSDANKLVSEVKVSNEPALQPLTNVPA
jgi:hypothetical protein